MIRIPLALLALAALGGAVRAQEPALTLDLGGGISMELVLVRAGQFQQGSPAGEAGRGDDETQRQVTILHDFYMGRTAVTRGQWEQFARQTGYRSEAEVGTSGGFGWDGQKLTQRKDFTWRNPGFPQDASHPVCIVTFPDAEKFCQWLQSKAGRRLTLPTEAQWEYACRAGTTGAWHNNGDETASGAIAWHKRNAGNSTHPAASTQANPWGLHMGGNVAEWCLDWYGPYPSGPATDPVQMNQNLSDKPRRVLRGGSWSREAKNTRSAARFRADPRSRMADIGFRVVCDVAALPVAPPPPPMAELPPGAQLPSPGAPPPPVRNQLPTTGHPVPPSLSVHSSPATFPVGGIFCLAIPLVIVIAGVAAVVIKLSGRRGWGGFGSGSRISSRPLVPSGAAPHQVRITDDGFWLTLDAPVGTMVSYTYQIAGGGPVTQRTAYQPGPEGQFIYTHGRPVSVSVSGSGGPGDEIDDNTMIPPVLPMLSDPDPEPSRSFHHSSGFSAY